METKKICMIENCNKPATESQISIIGQITFYLCAECNKLFSSAYDGDRLGLLDKNNKWAKIKSKNQRDIIMETKKNKTT